MYTGANYSIQGNAFAAKGKTDVKNSSREKNSKFEDSLMAALQESTFSKQSPSDIKKERVVTSKEEPVKQEKESSLENDLDSTQAAKALFLLNPELGSVFNAENGREISMLTAAIGDVNLESTGSVSEAAASSLNQAANVPENTNVLQAAVGETVVLPENKKAFTEMKETVKTGETEKAAKADNLFARPAETEKTGVVAEKSKLGDMAQTGQKENQKSISSSQNTEKQETPPEILTASNPFKGEALDFSKVNIKVGENTENADPQILGKEVAESILHHASEGKNIFEVQLNPEELGKIQIKLTFESGKASVLLSCSNAKTQEILMSQSENIRHIIEQQTGSETIVTVKEEAYTKQQDFDGRGQNRREEEQKQQMQREDSVNAEEFVKQLKLGLTGKEESYAFN